jgi:type I restriction enzyme S subunit
MKLVPLEKIVDILDNQRIPINSTERNKRRGVVPYYGATGQVGTIDKAIFNETLILLGEDGVPFFDSTKHKAYEISGPSWVNNHAHVLRAKPELVVQRYLLHFLNGFNYAGYVNGATRLKLTQGDMKRIPVPLPSLEKQREIVEKLDSAFAEIDLLDENLVQQKSAIAELRNAVLASAFDKAVE